MPIDSWQNYVSKCQRFVNIDRWLGIRNCAQVVWARTTLAVSPGSTRCQLLLRSPILQNETQKRMTPLEIEGDRFPTTSFASEFHLAIWKGLELPALLLRSKKHQLKRTAGLSSCCCTHYSPDPVKLYWKVKPPAVSLCFELSRNVFLPRDLNHVKGWWG